ncbi:N-formylglutamate amidohydrolase [Rhodohalobacter sp. 8-1]|uniref:N-formylglutamate amidohydrolase n=1 Tax=Rhodohalobacter sp. 8-1 TaxID=3131972 RepID=UPI0030EF4E9A
MNNSVIVCEMESYSSHKFIITCEHASNRVPDKYAHLFTDAKEVLSSHRGWDPGAIVLAYTIYKAVRAPILSHPISRLLIEPNRSLHHPRLFSEFSKHLSNPEKENLINTYYLPYRKRAEEIIAATFTPTQQVIHLGIHTFTPTLNETVRNFDIGLLYDPSRSAEKEFCKRWKQSLVRENTSLKIKMNQPYQGKSDGFTTYLRRRLGDHYLGIELEVNQRHFFDSGQHWGNLCRIISDSLLHIQ